LKELTERLVREFYYAHSAQEKTGKNRDKGTEKVDAMPIAAVVADCAFEASSFCHARLHAPQRFLVLGRLYRLVVADFSSLLLIPFHGLPPVLLRWFAVGVWHTTTTAASSGCRLLEPHTC
jgi:hypothetical protein